MRANRSMPECTVIPELPYSDVESAVDWLCAAYGFTPRVRMGTHRAQLNVGAGAVVVMEVGENDVTCAVMVRIEDLDRHYADAVRAGAAIVKAPADYPYGERQYTARDPGHLWTFSQTIADVAPEDWGGIAVVPEDPEP
jgi:uncharacterized glyoxalase superfamily protein PhnB